MTPANLSALLLADIGRRPDDADPQHTAWLAHAIATAIEEISRLAPGFFTRRWSVVTSGAQSATYDASGESTLTIDGDPGGQYDGCAASMAGRWRRLYWDAAQSHYTVVPALDAAGQGSATIIIDGWRLPSWCRATGGQVMRDGIPLQILTSRAQIESMTRWYNTNDYGQAPGSLTAHRFTGRPWAFWIERATLGSGLATVTGQYLRVAPMPDGIYTIEIDLRVSPPLVTADTLSSADPLLIPGNDFHSILVPVARRYWSSAPWWDVQKASKNVGADYQAAISALFDWREDPSACPTMKPEYF